MLTEATLYHHWHAVTAEDVYQRLETNRTGLTEKEAVDRKVFSENLLTGAFKPQGFVSPVKAY